MCNIFLLLCSFILLQEKGHKPHDNHSTVHGLKRQGLWAWKGRDQGKHRYSNHWETMLKSCTGQFCNAEIYLWIHNLNPDKTKAVFEMFQLARAMHNSHILRYWERKKRTKSKTTKGLILLWGALQGNREATIHLYLEHLPEKCESWHLESYWSDEVKSHNCLNTVSFSCQFYLCSTIPNADGMVWIKVFNNQAQRKQEEIWLMSWIWQGGS